LALLLPHKVSSKAYVSNKRRIFQMKILLLTKCNRL
jgi:hypothetical protein